MTVAVSQAIKNVFVERCDPHCIAWIRATASLWGMSSEHDLDEPVQLSDEMPLRVRWATVGDSLEIIPDRDVSLKATRNGTHSAFRINVRGRMLVEIEIRPPRLRNGETVLDEARKDMLTLFPTEAELDPK